MFRRQFLIVLRALISLATVQVIFLNLSLILSTSQKLKETVDNENKNSSKNFIEIKPVCACEKSIYLEKVDENTFKYLKNYSMRFESLNLTSQYLNKNVETTLISNPIFTCDIYNELKNGPNQKILSYSLYGRSYSSYSNDLNRLIKSAKRIYPDWLIRIYYESDVVDENFVCGFQCKYKEKVSFCDINKLPFTTVDYLEFNNAFNQVKRVIKSYKYVHAMMWRWMPMADSFVDYFASRDMDSSLIQREKDSVDVWMAEKNLFHVMRDHPSHNIDILGGLRIKKIFNQDVN